MNTLFNLAIIDKLCRTLSHSTNYMLGLATSVGAIRSKTALRWGDRPIDTALRFSTPWSSDWLARLKRFRLYTNSLKHLTSRYTLCQLFYVCGCFFLWIYPLFKSVVPNREEYLPREEFCHFKGGISKLQI